MSNLWRIGEILGGYYMLDNYTDVLTVKEAQEILKINKKTLYRLIDNREIFAKKIGKVYRIPKQSLCEYILGEEQ